MSFSADCFLEHGCPMQSWRAQADAEKCFKVEELHALRVRLCERLGWTDWASRLANQKPLLFPPTLQLI